MKWDEACKRLNAIPWEINEKNMADVWQGVLWTGGTDGKMITKNRHLSARLIAYMAGESLSDDDQKKLLEDYRSMFPEQDRENKVLPKKVSVQK